MEMTLFETENKNNNRVSQPPSSIKHDKAYDEAIKKATEDFTIPSHLELSERCPYIFSSNDADAYWITAYSLYHSGRAPRALKPTRGHKWMADLPGHGIVVLSVEKPDHREGVTIHS